MLFQSHARSFHSFALAALACMTGNEAKAFEMAHLSTPIGRIARIFDSQLVRTEDRISWLDSRISTFAQHREHSMTVGLGHRGYRPKKGDPDPTVTIDLGKVLPLDTIFLVPSQRESFEDTGLFPKRYTLELSNHPDFAQPTVLFTSSTTSPTSRLNDGNPVPHEARNITARYVRLVVHEGHDKGMIDLFGLSEIVVMSENDAVSFGAAVTSVGNLNAQGIWYPESLTDGRMPLGIWQNGGKPTLEVGDSVNVTRENEPVSWSISLPQIAEIDRLVLFPYQLDRSFESSIIPESISVHLQDSDGKEETLAAEWKNPLPGSVNMTPIVIPLGGKSGKNVRVTGVRPWVMGDLKIQALSEIEVWSGGRNLANSLPVNRRQAGQSTVVTALTDGYTSDSKIVPIGIWLEQLSERGRIERELAILRPIHLQLASEGELNATWGSAVVLGLTFLIPVFIVERRRLMTRDQLDKLRKRIASDLHDDIGSNLGSISLIARSARKDLVRLQGPEEVADDLGEVESIARESSLAMRDIVWLLERHHDSIGDLVQRMRETAGRLLREISHTVDCDSKKTTAKLSLDAKRHLFLFYKEAIHNVIKHSQASRVSIRLWDEDDKLALEILDNGVGLPLNDDTKSITVQKLEDRARVLDGLLQIASSKEKGTAIRLFVKRSHLTAHPTLA